MPLTGWNWLSRAAMHWTTIGARFGERTRRGDGLVGILTRNLSGSPLLRRSEETVKSSTESMG
jgi:hypothetical protein